MQADFLEPLSQAAWLGRPRRTSDLPASRAGGRGAGDALRPGPSLFLRSRSTPTVSAGPGVVMAGSGTTDPPNIGRALAGDAGTLGGTRPSRRLRQASGARRKSRSRQPHHEGRPRQRGDEDRRPGQAVVEPAWAQRNPTIVVEVVPATMIGEVSASDVPPRLEWRSLRPQSHRLAGR